MKEIIKLIEIREILNILSLNKKGLKKMTLQKGFITRIIIIMN